MNTKDGKTIADLSGEEIVHLSERLAPFWVLLISMEELAHLSYDIEHQPVHAAAKAALALKGMKESTSSIRISYLISFLQTKQQTANA